MKNRTELEDRIEQIKRSIKEIGYYDLTISLVPAICILAGFHADYALIFLLGRILNFFTKSNFTKSNLANKYKEEMS